MFFASQEEPVGSATLIKQTELKMNVAPERSQSPKDNRQSSFTLETIIAMGLFSWLALSMTLMGLGIW